MNDPHVLALHYTLTPIEHPAYENPPALRVQQPEFELELRDGHAVLQMILHCATQEQARSMVEPFLRAWEIDSALNSGGRPQLQFRFQRAKIIDRNPSPSGTVQLRAASARSRGQAIVAAIGETARHQYPAPPTIRITADVETLWFRYSLYKGGRDSLTGMAYFCMTYVEWLKRDQAADLAISNQILSTLGRLTSIGDAMTARKWDRPRERRRHTSKEFEWMDAAVRALIRRVGERAAGTPPRQLTMADLPPLD